MRSSFAHKASWTVICLFVITMALSLFVPTYTDEITSKIARIQVIFDGFELTSLFPQCGADISLPVPLTWYPSAFLDWLIYGHVTNPIFLRVIGVSTFMLWLGMLALFMRRHLKAQGNSLYLLAGLLAITSLGTLPFMLALNRSEQVLLVGLTLVCLLPFDLGQRRVESPWYWLLLVGAFFLMVSYMFSSHPKTFFFVPLILVSAIHLSVASRRVWVGVILLGGVGWICFESLLFWNKRMYCPDAPILDAILRSHNLSIGSMLTSPQDFFVNGMKNLISDWRYLDNILFHSAYQSDWLPRSEKQKHDLFTLGVNLGVVIVYLVCISYIFLAIVKRVHVAWLERKFEVGTTIPLTLLFCVISTSFLMSSRNFYESSLILPLLILLALILSLDSQVLKDKAVRYPYLIGFLLIVSIASQLNLYRTFSNAAFTSWQKGGQVEDQPLSVAAVGYGEVREDILHAAAQCGIQAGGVNSHLVVDDSTYLTFSKAYRPIHAGYIGGFFGGDIGDEKYFSFLKQQKSAGLITRCDKLSPFVRGVSTESSSYCCISEQDINKRGMAVRALGG